MFTQWAGLNLNGYFLLTRLITILAINRQTIYSCNKFMDCASVSNILKNAKNKLSCYEIVNTYCILAKMKELLITNHEAGNAYGLQSIHVMIWCDLRFDEFMYKYIRMSK